MADLPFDGNVKVQLVQTIANLAAPAAATEVKAASSLALEYRIVPDGLTTNFDTDGIDNSSLGSTFTTMQTGRRKPTIALKLKRGTVAAGDDKWYTTMIYQSSWFLVVRRTLAVATDWAQGQMVEVYPVQCGEMQPDPPGPSKLQTVTVPMFVTADVRGPSNPATLAT